MKKWLLFSYFVLFLLFVLFSYVFADPNLFLWKGEWFVDVQTWLWRTILPKQLLRTYLGAGLLLALFCNYLLILRQFAATGLANRAAFWRFLFLLSVPLLLSYNALSYDIFNYIFNAKMVLDFGANPHVRTAQEFSDEPMLRFMNNIHTVAPYGYGWTALSLLPYALGLGKFILQFLSFKAFAALSLFLGLLVMEKLLIQQHGKVSYQKLAWFFLNPLVLIEVLSSGHNDLFMMVPALFAIYLALNDRKQHSWTILIIVAAMALSISIKFATLALLPFFVYLLIKNKLPKIENYFDFLSLALFVPLLTERSKQFLPWYLLWSLIFLPLGRQKLWRELLIVFSLSALLRYVPWMYYVPWMSFHLDTSQLLNYQKLVTWVIPGCYFLLRVSGILFNKYREK